MCRGHEETAAGAEDAAPSEGQSEAEERHQQNRLLPPPAPVPGPPTREGGRLGSLSRRGWQCNDGHGLNSRSTSFPAPASSSPAPAPPPARPRNSARQGCPPSVQRVLRCPAGLTDRQAPIPHSDLSVCLGAALVTIHDQWTGREGLHQ